MDGLMFGDAEMLPKLDVYGRIDERKKKKAEGGKTRT